MQHHPGVMLTEGNGGVDESGTLIVALRTPE